jgi:hypothetical protein
MKRTMKGKEKREVEVFKNNFDFFLVFLYIYVFLIYKKNSSLKMDPFMDQRIIDEFLKSKNNLL